MQNASLNLVTDATVEPVSVAEAKAYLRIESGMTDHDTLIGSLISSARRVAEAVCHREIARKTWRLSLDRFPPFTSMQPFPLPYVERAFATPWQGSALAIPLLDPLVSVDTFTYRKSDGSTVTMVANTDYLVDSDKHPGVVVPPYNSSWPGADLWPSSAVKIEFKAGYLPAECPAEVKNGILMLVVQNYDAPEPFMDAKFAGELPFSVSALFGSDALYKF